MRDSFKKCMNSQIVEPFAVGFISVLILEYIVYPKLTIGSNVVNLTIGSICIGLVILMISYIKLKFFTKKEVDVEDVVVPESGETELDYIPEEEVKKKRITKKTVKEPIKTKMNAKKTK